MTAGTERKVYIMLRNAFLAFSLLAFAAPDAAAAGCASKVDATKARLASLEKEAAAGAPQESWFGEPSSAMDVKKLLDGAQDLARDGKEAACEEQLVQAKSVLGGLESKRDEQKQERARKTNEIKKDLKDAPADGKTGKGG